MKSIPGRSFLLFPILVLALFSIVSVRAQDPGTPSSQKSVTPQPLKLKAPSPSQMYKSLGVAKILGPVKVQSPSSKPKPDAYSGEGGDTCPGTVPEEGEDDPAADECEGNQGVYIYATCECRWPNTGSGSTPSSQTQVSQSGAVYGQTAPAITATVSLFDVEGSPTPEGTVYFSMVSTSGSGLVPVPNENDPLINSVATWYMNNMEGGYPIPAGSYKTTGLYVPDDPDAYPGSQGQGNLGISKMPTDTIVLNCPTVAVTSGTTLSVTIIIYPADEVSVNGPASPTGNIIFYDNGNPSKVGVYQSPLTAVSRYSSETYPVASSATIKYPVSGTGVHTIYGGYQGDTNYTSATGNSCSITVH
jgi:hypothetical protein